jgi:xanthine dehydrogenase small subunit
MQGKVASIRIAHGGMAATPKRASNVEAALVGKPWNEESVEAALEAYGLDYQPLSDMRATADYRLLVAKNLLRRFYAETQGESEPLRKPNVEAA